MEPWPWTTKEGKKIEVRDMDDSHLVNAYRMLKRQGCIDPSVLKFYLRCPPPNGDMAEMTFEQECDQVFAPPTSPFIGWFEAEAKRRGIDLERFHHGRRNDHGDY